MLFFQKEGKRIWARWQIVFFAYVGEVWVWVTGTMSNVWREKKTSLPAASVSGLKA
jgi:hypothetical protein